MPKNTTILALASAAAALATAASALAEEMGATTNINPITGDTPENPNLPVEIKRARGRPPATDKPAETGAPGKPEFKTLEELKEIIKPLFAESRGSEVKAILTKMGIDGLKNLPNEKQAEFLKDVEALSI